MFQVELRRPKERCWCCVVAILSASFPEAFPHVVVAIASAAALVHPAPACPSEEMVALCVGEWSGRGGRAGGGSRVLRPARRGHCQIDQRQRGQVNAQIEPLVGDCVTSKNCVIHHKLPVRVLRGWDQGCLEGAAARKGAALLAPCRLALPARERRR